MKTEISSLRYRKDPKFSDRQIWANSADPDQTAPQQSDQGLHCLPMSQKRDTRLICFKPKHFVITRFAVNELLVQCLSLMLTRKRWADK